MFYQGILKIWAFSKIEEFLRRGIERTHCARSPCRRSTAILPLRCYLLIANNDKQFWLTLCTHSTHWECAPLLWPSSISAKGLVAAVATPSSCSPRGGQQKWHLQSVRHVYQSTNKYNPPSASLAVRYGCKPTLSKKRLSLSCNCRWHLVHIPI